MVWRTRLVLRRQVVNELDKCARIYGVAPRRRWETRAMFKRRVVAVVLTHYDACRVSHG